MEENDCPAPSSDSRQKISLRSENCTHGIHKRLSAIKDIPWRVGVLFLLDNGEKQHH
jgi:hypothetical protein